ncbi:MAG: DUF6600 domain-containing protein [Pseudomonadota bacterium]
MTSRWRQAAVLALAAVLCGAAWADPPGRVGRLAELQGTVWMYDHDHGEWVDAVRNHPITSGDRLSTDGDARAELRIGSTTVRLDADTQLDVVELDDEHLRFQLHSGRLAVRARSNEVASEIEVATTDGRFLPQRAGHYRIDRDETLSAATVWAGELRFDGGDSALELQPGQRAEFWKESGVTHYTWGSPPRDGFGDWAQSEDRRDEREAHRYVSPEMTGWEDLDRHGRWERHPEYGALWIPVHVVPGWAPYRYGRWAWVRPWGWTWVDDAPWGFAPFHYGRWLWWGGRWCWAPGAYVARPVYAPALVGWVGGPSVNVSIHIGSGPVVGWVPLSPLDVYRPWYPLPRHHWRYVNPRTPDRFYRPGEPPQGPVMYTNRGVPGGVTVVPSDVLKRRQPIGNVARQVDPKLAQQFVRQPGVHQVPPPANGAVRPAPVVPRPVSPAPRAPAVQAPARPAEPTRPPSGAEGRRGHGVVVPPARREPGPPTMRPPAAREEAPRAAEPPRPEPPPAAQRVTPTPRAPATREPGDGGRRHVHRPPEEREGRPGGGPRQQVQ